MQSDAQEKTRPCGTNFSDKYTQVAGGTWTLHQGSTPGVSGTCADSSNVPSYLSPHTRVGSREGGSMPTLGGLAWIMALSCHPRKLWSWKWSLCSPTRRMKRNQERRFLLCWQPLIRGEPLVSQLGAGLLPLQQGQAGSLCALLQVSIKVFSISSAHLKS